MKIYSIIATAIVLLNVAAFAAFGIDKWKARTGRWRIPEATLLALAGLGGAIGAYLGMQVFHHKTQKPKFTIAVPLFIILHLGLVLWILIRRTQ